MTDLTKYTGMKICVAVSGGMDSTALLHYLYKHCVEYSITVCALNCNHRMRGVTSDRDSGFVKQYCAELGVPLMCFEWNTDERRTESSARQWRLDCYAEAMEKSGADCVATAHHLDDNAETVLFNLARGSALSGLTGITEGGKIIRPFIGCTRAQIAEYVRANGIPYVEDETNFTDDYTRNMIRHNVLPELEKAVPGASKAVYRFSRLAGEDEEYFDSIIRERGLIVHENGSVALNFCKEKVIFRRTAVKAVKDIFGRKDYTSATAERLYELQFAENGKKFGFLGLTAYSEKGRIVITEDGGAIADEIPFRSFGGAFGEYVITFSKNPPEGRALKFDYGKIPQSAVVRTMRAGDRFTKYGGGTKNLGDWFTDKKIPLRLRGGIPLIADGGEILAVCGYEISDKIKVTDETRQTVYAVCARSDKQTGDKTNA